MDLDIRTIAAEEVEDVVSRVALAFGEVMPEADLRMERSIAEPDRVLVAVDRGEVVGSATACSFRVAVPGGSAPAAGVTSVGVVPTHRRRGVLTALMRRQLDDVREAGEPLALLFASEGPIYGRFGYGVGTWSCKLEIDRPFTAFREPAGQGGRLRIVDKEEALRAMPAVHDRVLPNRPGMLERTEAWWAYRFYIPEHHDRDGFGPYFFVLHEGRDGPDGYVAYRVKPGEDEGPSLLAVEELVAASDLAYATLWRYCFDMDLIWTVRAAGRPPDEPLLAMVADPSRLNFTVRDGMYVRTVDVSGALEARRYAAEGRVVLEVRDAFCPWNEGRFELEAGPDGAACRRTDASPDLVLPAAALGSAYLGGITVPQLVRAGQVVEETLGAAARAGALFAWDPAPWSPHEF